VITDIEFLERGTAQRHFLYLYGRHSGLLRSRVRHRAGQLAERCGWTDTAPNPNAASLFDDLASASLLGERFIVCDARDRRIEDLEHVLQGIADQAFEQHVCLMVRDDSPLLARAAWREAVDRVGLIEEPSVTVDNYRWVVRYLLSLSDLGGLKHLGDNKPFMDRIRMFVRQKRTLLELSMEIERLFLTQMRNGVLSEEEEHLGSRQRQRVVLRDLLNQFLDAPNMATLCDLLKLLGSELRSGTEPERLPARLYEVSESIVAGTDRRYLRNREGNPAVLPYLAWAAMLLANEGRFLSANFVVVLEHLGQLYHSAAQDPPTWFAGTDVWQHMSADGTADTDEDLTRLDRARAGLQKALATRVASMPERPELRWLASLLGRPSKAISPVRLEERSAQ
jgi:hypothetical protein